MVLVVPVFPFLWESQFVTGKNSWSQSKGFAVLSLASHGHNDILLEVIYSTCFLFNAL